jgi:hypothetical protein
MNALNDWGELFAMLHTSPKTGEEKKAVAEEAPQAAPATPVADAPVVEEPKAEPEPVSRDEWEQLSDQQRRCEEMVEAVREKIRHVVSLCGPNQQPKGIRTILSHLDSAADAAVATKALVDFYLGNNVQQLRSIEESKLKRMAVNIFRSLQERKPRLLASFDELESMVRAGEERVILNLRTRGIKGQSFKLMSEAERQAKAFSKAIDRFPSEDGSLDLLKRFAERGDQKVMTAIDNTLNLAGTAMVLVADAPAMLVALKNNDTDAMVSLQKKLIDNMFDKK